MMMTALRQVTVHLGLLKEAPPESMVRSATPSTVDRIGEGRRAALTEFLHWAYGAGGGAAFRLLPGQVRAIRGAGAAYGLALWLGYELGLAPLLGEKHPTGKVVGRAMVGLDHLLYGIVVAERFPPRT